MLVETSPNDAAWIEPENAPHSSRGRRLKTYLGYSAIFTASVVFIIVAIFGLSRMGQAFSELQRAEKFELLKHVKNTEIALAKTARSIGEPGIDGLKLQNLTNLKAQLKVLHGYDTSPWTSEAGHIPDADLMSSIGMVTADAGALTAYLIDNGLADRHALLARIDAFGIELDRLSTRLSSEDEAHYTSMEAAIGQAQSMFKWQLGGTLLLAIILIVVMMREIRHFRSAMVRTTADLQRAESASEAKSRFLTMMNHELRTPMNGVMGLLALTRQTGLTPRQDRLLLQAERAGRKMSDLLGDILDYSELQGESLKLRRAPVAMADLIGQLEIALAETVKEKAADIDISPNFDEPAAVLIDSERLCQAVRQILRYLIDMVETGQLRVEIHHRGTRLELSIQCETASVAGPGWQPEMVFSGEPRGTDRFASDAIGPAIARGLVARMGGVIELRRHAERRVDLILQIPAEPAPLVLQLARIETNSATSAALVFAMLDREGWQIWRAGEPDQPVTLVVVELGGQNEAALAARLRVQHPEAWLVAIGRAEQPALFDATCSSLTDPKVLLDAVSGQPRLSQVAS